MMNGGGGGDENCLMFILQGGSRNFGEN